MINRLTLTQGASLAALWLLLFAPFGHAQPDDNRDSLIVLKEARETMQLLTSDYMAGRGYLDDGHEKAARFIAENYLAIGLQPIATKSRNVKAYLQNIDFVINLVRDARLGVDGLSLKIGEDFIVHEQSGSIDGSFDVADVGYGLPGAYENVKGKVIVVRTGLPEVHTLTPEQANLMKSDDYKIQAALAAGASGLIILKPKLTASFSSETAKLPIVEVLNDRWPATPCRRLNLYVRQTTKQTIKSFNVVGMLNGKQKADTAIIICAHYDHLGRVGEAIFPGANDNASGVSFLLSVAKYFKRFPPKYTMIFIAFGGEEAGLHGSNHYALQEALFPLEATKFVLNFDLMGNGETGVMTVGGKTFPQLFDRLTAVNNAAHYIEPLQARENAPNSDHYPFTLRNVQALFFYTMGGAPHYHDVYDKPEGLAMPAFYNMRRLVTSFIESYY